MRTRRIRFVVAAALGALAVAPAPNVLAASGVPSGRPVTERDFAVKNFSARSTTVDNRFLPLPPGKQWTLTGTTTAGKHEVVFTVTNVTKWVDHVRTVVLWDRDFQDGVLAEEELAFMAQDDAGNVWSLGEYPEEHAADGTVSAPRTWLGGHLGATPGVLMRADPKTNTSSYLQGLAPAVQFIDKAKVFQTGQTACVPTGCYNGVLVVDEWNPQAQPQDGQMSALALATGPVSERRTSCPCRKASPNRSATRRRTRVTTAPTARERSITGGAPSSRRRPCSKGSAKIVRPSEDATSRGHRVAA